MEVKSLCQVEKLTFMPEATFLSQVFQESTAKEESMWKLTSISPRFQVVTEKVEPKSISTFLDSLVDIMDKVRKEKVEPKLT